MKTIRLFIGACFIGIAHLILPDMSKDPVDWDYLDDEDLEDDIEIEADELLRAWDEGERPEDLQMF